MQMSKHELRALTLKGARTRLAELDEERPRLAHLIKAWTHSAPKTTKKPHKRKASKPAPDRSKQVAGIRRYWKKKRAEAKAARKAAATKK